MHNVTKMKNDKIEMKEELITIIAKNIRLVLAYNKSRAEIEVINTFTNDISKFIGFNFYNEETLYKIDEIIYGPGQDIILDYLYDITYFLQVNANLSLETIKEYSIKSIDDLFMDTDLSKVLVNNTNNLYSLIQLIGILGITKDNTK